MNQSARLSAAAANSALTCGRASFAIRKFICKSPVSEGLPRQLIRHSNSRRSRKKGRAAESAVSGGRPPACAALTPAAEHDDAARRAAAREEESPVARHVQE